MMKRFLAVLFAMAILLVPISGAENEYVPVTSPYTSVVSSLVQGQNDMNISSGLIAQQTPNELVMEYDKTSRTYSVTAYIDLLIPLQTSSVVGGLTNAMRAYQKELIAYLEGVAGGYQVKYNDLTNYHADRVSWSNDMSGLGTVVQFGNIVDGMSNYDNIQLVDIVEDQSMYITGTSYPYVSTSELTSYVGTLRYNKYRFALTWKNCNDASINQVYTAQSGEIESYFGNGMTYQVNNTCVMESYVVLPQLQRFCELSGYDYAFDTTHRFIFPVSFVRFEVKFDKPIAVNASAYSAESSKPLVYYFTNCMAIGHNQLKLMQAYSEPLEGAEIETFVGTSLTQNGNNQVQKRVGNWFGLPYADYPINTPWTNLAEEYDKACSGYYFYNQIDPGTNPVTIIGGNVSMNYSWIEGDYWYFLNGYGEGYRLTQNGETVSTKFRDIDSYVFSFGAGCWFQQRFGLTDSYGNGGTGGYSTDNLYFDVSYEWGEFSIFELFNFLAHFFTQVIPKTFANFIIWVFVDSPLISNATRPLFLSLVGFKDFIGKYLLTPIGVLGTFGAFLIGFVIVKIIRRVYG